MYKIVPTNPIQHSWAGSDKNYSTEEKAKEKKYNHEYYMKNKEKFGEDYEAVQKRVNELMKKSNVKHSYTIVTENELYHHGIIGQKWGVRRFQNSNGSLTAAGRQRYNTDKSGLSQQETNTVLNEAGNIARNSNNASKSINKIKKSEEAKKREKEKLEKDAPKKVEEMSDKELREFLNRYDMEQRYEKIQKESKKDILTGQEKVQEILEVTKDVAAIAVSAATIYAIINGKK